MHKHFALSAATLLTGKRSEERSEARAPIALFLDDVTRQLNGDSQLATHRERHPARGARVRAVLARGRRVVEERYQAKGVMASQIEDDPNDWLCEVEDPSCILDPLAQVAMAKVKVKVKVKTVEIVGALPPLVIAGA